MKILVLDDDETRLQAFKDKLVGHEVLTATTAQEAIESLKSTMFDAVFLDHDLGGQIYQASGPETGYEVAVWLRDNPERKPQSIVIHSFNAPGARNMLAVLPEAVYEPGAWTLLQKDGC